MSLLVSLAWYLMEIDIKHGPWSTSSDGVASNAEPDANHSTPFKPPSRVLPPDRERVEQEDVYSNM